MNEGKKRLQKLLDQMIGYLPLVRRYILLVFLAFVGLIYLFLLFRVQSLSNQQPTEDQITSQFKASRVPHIDQGVVQQLQTLQDNSVNVKALFNQARNNPFQ